MFKFFVVAAPLFLVFSVCLFFDDLAKQWRKMFGGVSEVGKTISLFIFVGLASFSWFFFSLLQSRATKCTRHPCKASYRLTSTGSSGRP